MKLGEIIKNSSWIFCSFNSQLNKYFILLRHGRMVVVRALIVPGPRHVPRAYKRSATTRLSLGMTIQLITSLYIDYCTSTLPTVYSTSYLGSLQVWHLVPCPYLASLHWGLHLHHRPSMLTCSSGAARTSIQTRHDAEHLFTPWPVVYDYNPSRPAS